MLLIWISLNCGYENWIKVGTNDYAQDNCFSVNEINITIYDYIWTL